MAESTFNLFGPITKNDIRGAYISTERGYTQGVSLCEANSHAKRNPGETFIYKPTRETIQFLNINEVNKLAEDPLQFEKNDSCPGEDGLNLKGIPRCYRSAESCWDFRYIWRFVIKKTCKELFCSYSIGT